MTNPRRSQTWQRSTGTTSNISQLIDVTLQVKVYDVVSPINE
jgi:hypothetical protein